MVGAAETRRLGGGGDGVVTGPVGQKSPRRSGGRVRGRDEKSPCAQTGHTQAQTVVGRTDAFSQENGRSGGHSEVTISARVLISDPTIQKSETEPDDRVTTFVRRI